MKILKRNYTHRNLFVFLVLSLIYLQAIYSLSRGISILSIDGLKSVILNNYFIISMTAVALYSIYKIKKRSAPLLLLCLTLIVGKSFILLSGSFNKLTLVLNFIYLIFAFYFFITGELEVVLASFNPLFSKYDLEKESRCKMDATISLDDKNATVFNALITNIDHDSCFLLLTNNAEKTLPVSKIYYIESNFEGVIFKHEAHLVSSYSNGRGFRFGRANDSRVSWSELYKVCLERGIFA
jgi:hypothetical protein